MEVVPTEKLFGELFEAFVFDEKFPGPGKRIEVSYEDAKRLAEKVRQALEESPELAGRLEECGMTAFKVMAVWLEETEARKRDERIRRLIPEKYRKYFENPNFSYEMSAGDLIKRELEDMETAPEYTAKSSIAYWVFDAKDFGEPEVFEIRDNVLYINGKRVAEPVQEGERTSTIGYLKYVLSEKERKEWIEVVDSLAFYEPVVVVFDEIEEGIFEVYFG
ncbi:hypothetical protein HG1285_13087 [Hydrogenivirga sp. 128-5-R1-1]|nr:hypothetical protein HG1285_13087 [Hydrogenivirga sp. 128-5-R1-1]